MSVVCNGSILGHCDNYLNVPIEVSCYCLCLSEAFFFLRERA